MEASSILLLMNIREGTVRNELSRDTENIGHTRHKTKSNKTKQSNAKQFLLLIRHSFCSFN